MNDLRSSRLYPPTVAFGLGKRLLCGSLLALVLLLVPQTAYAQQDCEDALTKANDNFLRGRFDDASGRLEACLRQDTFSEEEKPEVYKLLVRIYDAKQLEEKVEETLAELLALVPNYEPNSGDSPRFRELVESFKEQMPADPDPPAAIPPPENPDPEEANPVSEEAPDPDDEAPDEEEETPVVDDETPAPPEERTPPEEDVAEPMPAPEVTIALAEVQGDAVFNVRLQQDGDRQIVFYDLEGSAKKYKVRLLLSNDGGQSFTVVPTAIRGDVGKGIRPGTDKQVVWAVLDDFPQGLGGDQYRLQVEARKQSNRGLLYVLGGAVIAGGAGTVALLAGGGGGDGGGPVDPGPAPIPLPPGRVGGN